MFVVLLRCCCTQHPYDIFTIKCYIDGTYHSYVYLCLSSVRQNSIWQLYHGLCLSRLTLTLYLLKTEERWENTWKNVLQHRINSCWDRVPTTSLICSCFGSYNFHRQFLITFRLSISNQQISAPLKQHI